jgi:ABC-type proline/glycine betaine transport system ATPase subunit
MHNAGNRKVNMKLKIYDIINRIKWNIKSRIADALEEILRLVKLDQEKMAKRFPDEDQE